MGEIIGSGRLVCALVILLLASYNLGAVPLAVPEVKSKRLRCCYVPTAANVPGDEDEPSSMRHSWQSLERHGFDLFELDLTDDCDEQLITNALDCADAVHVAGGNTFYLLQQMRRTGFDRAITTYVDSGRPYFGGSAGAVAACPDIGFAAPFDDPADAPLLESTRGLGLVPFLVAPHFQPGYLVDIDELATQKGLEVIAITDSQAILVTDDGYRVVPS